MSRMAASRGRPPHDDILTPAEWRTVDAVRHGLTNREIAERRGISLDAVKYHVANAIAKLGLENRHALRFWRGIPKGSAANNRSTNMSQDPGIVGIGQIARTVGDLRLAESWYRDTLGLTHLFTFGNLAFFDCGGTRLMLSESESGPAPESIVYLRVVDIHAACDQLKTRGVEFVNAPHMIHRHENGTEEWMAFFEDPDGRPLAIMAAMSSGEARD